MDKAALKDVIYGGLASLMENYRYFHKSSIDPSYSNWTAEGDRALHDFMTMIVQEIQRCEELDLDIRAKRLVMKSLKGNDDGNN